MTSTLPSISIGIPTYEGGECLVETLHSIYNQTAIRQIKEVLVVVDGNRLDTKTKKAIAHPKLRVILKKERLGQSSRLNDLCHEAKSSLLVLTNDDVVLAPNAVAELAQAHLKTEADLVTAYVSPLPSANLLGKCLAVGYALNHQIISLLPENSYLSCNGRLIALSKKLYTDLHIPATLWNNDAFIYFFAKANGFAYQHVPTAKVFFQSPSTLPEHLKQTGKFRASYKENSQYLKLNWEAEYLLPRNVAFLALWKTFLNQPFLLIGYILVLLYSRVLPIPTQPNSGVWATDSSTKMLPRKGLHEIIGD